MPNELEEVVVELRKIRELLQPKPARAPPKGILTEFKAFLSEYKVLGLAVAFIVGVYLGALVKAMVSDLLLPIVQLVIPTTTPINDYSVGPFAIGDFANALLTFIIVTIIIFVIAKLAGRYKIE